MVISLLETMAEQSLKQHLNIFRLNIYPDHFKCPQKHFINTMSGRKNNTIFLAKCLKIN